MDGYIIYFYNLKKKEFRPINQILYETIQHASEEFLEIVENYKSKLSNYFNKDILEISLIKIYRVKVINKNINLVCEVEPKLDYESPLLDKYLSIIKKDYQTTFIQLNKLIKKN